MTFPNILHTVNYDYLQMTVSFTEISPHKKTAINYRQTLMPLHDGRPIGSWPSIQTNALNLESHTKKHTFIHDYTLHNHTLESVSSAKYLGWNLHIDNIASNANKSLGFLKRNLKVSNTDIKSKAYQALVRPKLEYSCSVWDPHQSQHIHKLEMVQRRAARFVCNNYHNTSSVTDMVNTLQWPPLADRRLKSRLVIFYKIVHCLIAVPANHILIPTDSRTRHSHSLSYRHLQTTKAKSRKYQYIQMVLLSPHHYLLAFPTVSNRTIKISRLIQRTAVPSCSPLPSVLKVSSMF